MIPGSPSDLVAQALEPNFVHLSWVDNTTNESGFVVERGQNGSFTEIGRVAANQTVYDDTTVEDMRKYDYRVAAFDGDGSTTFSNLASVETPRGFYTLTGRVVEHNDFNPIAGAEVMILTGGNLETPVQTPHTSIPDSNSTGISEIIEVSETGIIDDMSVSVSIQHTYIGDLQVSIVHPDGTAVLLHDRSGSSSHDIVATYPDDRAPAQSLEVLKGKPLNGQWRLIVRDTAGGDTGTLDLVQLKFKSQSTPINTTTDANGYYRFENVGSGHVTLAARAPGYKFNPKSLELHTNAAHVNLISTP